MVPNKKNTAKKYTTLYGVAAVLMIAVVVSSHYAVEHFKNQKAQADFVLNPAREFHSDIVQPPAEPVKEMVTSPAAEQKKELKIPLHVLCKVKSIDAAHPVSPPLQEMIQQRKTVAVEATKGQVIRTEAESKISIPPDAFVDASGKAVRGQVDIKYREYHNYQDILFSGIPMTWKNGDKRQQLESAGMIELVAYKGKEELYVNPARRINVMLATAAQSKDMNLYYFDQRKKEWVMKGRPAVFEDADQSGWDIIDTIFNARVYDLKKYPVHFRSNSSMSKRRKFIFGKKEEPTDFDFMMYASTNGFPELKALSGQVWNYSGPDVLDVYTTLILEEKLNANFRPHVWQKMIITPSDTSEKYYTLSLCTSHDTMEIAIRPKLNGKRKLKKFEEKFDAYEAKYAARAEKEKKNYLRWQSDSVSAGGKFAVVNRYRASTSQVALRSFEIDRFGIWNCDRPIEIPQAVTVQASFSDQNGRALYPATVYLVDKNMNTVFTYYRNSTDSITFNPNSTNMIWMVLANGRMAVLKPVELKKNTFAKNSRQFNFVMQVYDKPKDEAEIKKLVTL